MSNTKSTIQFDYKKNIGWIDGPCLAIVNPDLKIGTVVNLILYENPQVLIKTKIKGKIISDDKCNALFEGRKIINQGNNRIFYSIELTEKDSEQMGVAIIGSDKLFRNVNGIILMDLDGDSKYEHATSCTGSEGLNFSINIKRENKIKVLWQDYYYLDYGITPDCPK